ncbi:MAG: ribosome biogenesis factor YjgA [Pseudomonadota bacterium]|jgi:ribosome-associated protein
MTDPNDPTASADIAPEHESGSSGPGISKTRRKRAAHDLQSLGERLVDLSREALASLDLPDALREAVAEARSLTRHEARRRQLQYIGRLMRDIDPSAIRERLAERDGTSAAAVARHHELERWRKRLMEDDRAFTEFAAAHPGCDLQQLRTLVRNAHREAELGRPPRSWRELFRVLRETLEPAPR